MALFGEPQEDISKDDTVIQQWNVTRPVGEDPKTRKLRPEERTTEKLPIIPKDSPPNQPNKK